jgi:hypothetical protein
MIFADVQVRLEAEGFCFMKYPPIQIGDTFDRYTVIASAGRLPNKTPLWLCRCTCGTEREIQDGNLKRGLARSCGCLKSALISAANSAHGESTPPTPEYDTWHGMIRRCRSTRGNSAANYKERGIQVCERWLSSYEAFLSDMGRRPSSEHSIDRIDNDGNYEPENCRWATRREQGRNRRTNRLITINGETRCLTEWSEMSGIDVSTLWRRLSYGWAEARLLDPLVRGRRRR